MQLYCILVMVSKRVNEEINERTSKYKKPDQNTN